MFQHDNLRVCPICNSSRHVSYCEKHYVCSSCKYTWVWNDKKKTTYVCPSQDHKQEILLAEIVDGAIEMECPTCKMMYVVPEEYRTSTEVTVITRKPVPFIIEEDF